MMSLLIDIKSSTAKTDEYMSRTDSKISGLSSDVEGMASTIKELQIRLAKLENQPRPTEVPSQSHDELTKQELLRRNISIFGVPFTENEDLNAIIEAIGLTINFNLARSDFSAYRTGANKSVIVVSFSNFRLKLELLQASKAKRTLRSSELGLSNLSTDLPIFINNQLTPYFGKLYNMARKAVADKKISTCWIAFNCVCIKQSAGGAKCLIKDIKAMEEICGSSSTTSAMPTPPEADVVTSQPRTTRANGKRKAPESSNSDNTSKIAKSSAKNTSAPSKPKPVTPIENGGTSDSTDSSVKDVISSNTT